MLRRALFFTLLFALLAAIVSPGRAAAVDRNFAGSAQLDYHFAPTQHGASAAGPMVFDGTTVEMGLKVAVDFSDHLSGNVKVCFGCHGFETDMVYLDYRVADELTIRLGRMSPSFGNFNIRHDPANHRLSDKPLPYDMGRMLRLREWNLGVLPSPFPDNGLELNGTHWFGEKVQLDYAAYIVSGFKGDQSSTDLDFQQSRSGSLYYVDNNGRPSFGGRAAITAKLGSTSDATLGASAMYGTFDPENKRSYGIFGADLTFRFDRTNLRLEYLVRRQQFDISDPARFKYLVPAEGGDFFVKHGAFIELEQPLSRAVDLIGRFDGLYRIGNLPAASTLQAKSAVIRYTLGTAITVQRGLRLKASAELWSFSDRGLPDRHNEMSFHLGAVGTF
jgi:hypothetical protein